MTTIKDVAELAGVHSGTVSRALNGSGYVAKETREKIEKAIKELNYVPNELARNLSNGRTMTVALVLPSLMHPFYSELFHELEMRLTKNKYKVLVCNTIDKNSDDKKILQMLQSNRVDGIILGGQYLKTLDILNSGIPVVSFERYFDKEIPVVYCNNADGGRIAANLFVEAGCKRVIQFESTKDFISFGHERHVVFEQILKKHGIAVDTIETIWNCFDNQYLEKTIGKYINETSKYDGFFATDFFAMSCLKQALKCKIEIPKDLKIVSFDGTYITNIAYPQLTVIRQPVDKIAEALVSTLLKRINKEAVKSKTIIPVKYIKGETT